MTAYAEVDDLQEYWRPLSAAEQDRADVLLGAAADLINEEPGSAKFSATTCKWVSLDVVKRVMMAGDGRAVEALDGNPTAYNPPGDMKLTRAEKARLAGRTSQSAFSLTLSSNAAVPDTPWNYQQTAQSGGS